MKPRCLLAQVDRLPTISETQEDTAEDGAPRRPPSTLEDYMDSIKELSSQPASLYPLHGPLRGHRRWAACASPRAPLFYSSAMTYAPWIPVDPSDVWLTLTDAGPDRVDAQSVFAGLV